MADTLNEVVAHIAAELAERGWELAWAENMTPPNVIEAKLNTFEVDIYPSPAKCILQAYLTVAGEKIGESEIWVESDESDEITKEQALENLLSYVYENRR